MSLFRWVLLLGLLGWMLPVGVKMPEDNYFPLQVGNRWVYQNSRDPENIKEMVIEDTVRIDVSFLGDCHER
jgi:hypothetical protein